MTIQDTIQLLIQLQDTDLASDVIQNKKGSLPKEIAKLEADLNALQKEQQAAQQEIEHQKDLINQQKEASQKATNLLVQYKQDHLGATNNKDEYDNITQEIALQELEIKLTQKKIKTAQDNITRQKDRLEEIKALSKENKETTKLKKERLEQIAVATQEEEAKLQRQRKRLLGKIPDKELLEKYQTLRKRFPFVVASVVQEACNGCFLVVPTQRPGYAKQKRYLCVSTAIGCL